MALNRKPMDISERAKQFMPFAALRGLEEALAKKEEEVRLSKERLSRDDGRRKEIRDSY